MLEWPKRRGAYDGALDGVESVALDVDVDGGLTLQINPSDPDRTCLLVRLGRGNPGDPHPTVLVGRGVEVALVRGLNEGEPDESPTCDLSTTVSRDPTTGTLEVRTDELDLAIGPHT